MSIYYDANLFIKKIKTNNSRVDNKTHILSVDFGTKKIGFAISDEEAKIAFPKETLLGIWTNIELATNVILENIKKYKAVAIVIGYPKKLDNSLHDNCIIITEIANNIEKFFLGNINYKKHFINDEKNKIKKQNNVKSHQLGKKKNNNQKNFVEQNINNDVDFPILLFDERYTTALTNSVYNFETAHYTDNCRQKKTKTNKYGTFDDAKSACIILNDVLSLFNK